MLLLKIYENMKNNDLEKILKSFANRRRLMTLKYLEGRGRASVGQIAEKIRLSFRSTSKHLSVMLASGVIIKKQTGRYVFYELNGRNKTAIKILKVI